MYENIGKIKEVYIPKSEVNKMEPASIGFIVVCNNEELTIEQKHDEASASIYKDDEVKIIKYIKNNEVKYLIEVVDAYE